MTNSVGFAQVDEMIDRLRGFPDAIRSAAPKIADRVREEVEKDIAAGKAPTGTQWPTKKDGSRALVNAAKHLTSKAVDTVILLTLTGPEVWHNFGTRRVPQRQILPGSVKGIAQAIRQGVVEVFKTKVAKRG